MKNFKNNFKKYCASSRFVSKSLAVLGGGLVGFVIGNWIGLVIGVVIGCFFEVLLAKAIQKSTFLSK